jgi:hypothetical protein
MQDNELIVEQIQEQCILKNLKHSLTLSTLMFLFLNLYQGKLTYSQFFHHCPSKEILDLIYSLLTYYRLIEQKNSYNRD